MSKKLSTYERKMKSVTFQTGLEEGYNELLMSELVFAILHSDSKTVCKLAKESRFSLSDIQKLIFTKYYEQYCTQ